MSRALYHLLPTQRQHCAAYFRKHRGRVYPGRLRVLEVRAIEEYDRTFGRLKTAIFWVCHPVLFARVGWRL